MSQFLQSNPIYKWIEPQWRQLPKVVKQFIVRALILWISWFILRHTIIKSRSGEVNIWLTKVTTELTISSLNQLYKPGFSMQLFSDQEELGQQLILYNGDYALRIGHPCNGFDLYCLYLGFLICAPGSLLRKIGFGLSGIFAILVLNVERCHGLSWLNLNKPEWTDFAHHYAFTFIVYAFIFMLWVYFLKNKTDFAD